MVEHGLSWRDKMMLSHLLYKIEDLDAGEEEKHRLRLVWMKVRDDLKKLEDMENEVS